MNTPWVRGLLAALLLAAGACGGAGAAADAGQDVSLDTRDAVAVPDLAPDDGPATPAELFQGPDWYRHAVLYQVWVRSFFDSNGDGIGDLKGITAKLDYVASLGVGAIWLSPFYPTPYVDSGYDVADYQGVDPAYGTLADFDELVAQAHARGLRVMNDVVFNHTSAAHPWYVQSRASTSNPKRDWYVWDDDGAPFPFLCPPGDPAVFGATGWTEDATTHTWYYHHFYPGQPDLNYENPDVVAAMQDVVRFWLERGVDGFRVDAIGTLFETPAALSPTGQEICDADPRTFAFCRELRTILDGYPNRAMLAEADGSAPYFGSGSDTFHLSMSFEVTVNLLASAAAGDARPAIKAWSRLSASLPEGFQFATFLSNHDRPRVTGGVKDDPRRAMLGAALLLTLPGTPIVYYGDELAMRNGSDVVVDVRDRSRTPMPWTAGPGVGFTTGTPWLDPAAGSDVANVATQEADPRSNLNLHRQLIALRNRLGGPGTAPATELPGLEGTPFRGFVREEGGARLIVIVNGHDTAGEGTLDLSAWLTREPEVVASFDAPALATETYASWTLTMPAYGFVVLAVKF